MLTSLTLAKRRALLLALIFCLSSSHVAHARRNRLLCNKLDPKCTLSPKQARSLFLTPYDQLLPKLRAIRAKAPFPIRIAPLILNSGNGFINIDAPLLPSLPNVDTTVCGVGTSPTIREAVLCTVRNDAVQPPRGNIDPAKVGFSTQGRPLLAVRIGSRRGKRVMVVTQQHGNEVGSTEGFLKFLHSLRDSRRLRRRILRLNLLIVVRANPDGGEPTADSNPPLIGPFTGSSGFFRHNVDPSAGGGFVSNTEDDFFGIVGRGYDLNRYHHVKLDAPIRPVETQALVAALHAFRPHYLLDLHGDPQKVFCEIDPSSVIPGALLGVLPVAQCLPPSVPIPNVREHRAQTVIASFFADDRASESRPLSRDERRLRKIISRIASKLQPRLVGKLARFSQILFGQAALSTSVLHKAPQDLGIIASGWEVLNFATAIRPGVSSLSFVDGNPVTETGVDLYEPEPCFLQDNICLHELLLKNMLKALSRETVGGNMKDDGFCDIPLATGLIQSRPARLGWGPAADENDSMIPLGGLFGAPVDISGTCPAP